MWEWRHKLSRTVIPTEPLSEPQASRTGRAEGPPHLHLHLHLQLFLQLLVFAVILSNALAR
jgi:hypothetical protein